ncbi:MAG TPA: HIT domain-containing protein [Candidatus Latescibacteria bacterium]|nr:HIT domain-containing protein [Candidatus Latescibacterota bacterium]
MDTLWAPWRMKYILELDRGDGCIFCDKVKDDKDRENLILCRGQYCYVMLNLFPYNNGHLMVIPYKHTDTLTDLSEPERLEFLGLTDQSLKVLQKVLEPDGFNLGINLGRSAGAGIEDHIHLHIVPRWAGDTNFMPVLGDTKVLSESLEETYRKLEAEFINGCSKDAGPKIHKG